MTDHYVTYLRREDPSAVGFGSDPDTDIRSFLMRQLFRTILEVVPNQHGKRSIASRIDEAERRQEVRDARRHRVAS